MSKAEKSVRKSTRRKDRRGQRFKASGLDLLLLALEDEEMGPCVRECWWPLTPKNNSWPIVSKEMGMSVLQPYGTKFYQ